jgi:hypothetical protein
VHYYNFRSPRVVSHMILGIREQPTVVLYL